MENHPIEPSKGNILIVDDTPENLRLLSSMLSRHGYEVRSVINGQMALMGVRADPPDLILLDINMPHLTGYEVCQQLKNDEATADIPIVFISALDDVLDKVKAFTIGGADYITKPFQLEEVLARVNNQLAVRRLQQLLKAKNEQLQREIQEHQQAKVALQAANQQLQHLATTDELTQVANRRYFYHYLQEQWQALAQAQQPLSLILCDVDHFKTFNDTYGHLAGDECLRHIAQAIRTTLKRKSDLVGRYGGEEFILLLPSTDAMGAFEVATSVLSAIRALKIKHEGTSTTGYVTVSLGVSSAIPNLDNSPESLIKVADTALYAAKAQGRNCVMLKTTHLSFP
ncbi:GGDEF domain-containing response regulator [Trichothermofontia sp.]